MDAQFNSYATRLVLLVLHAAGAGFASPAVVVVRPAPRTMEWLPMDNQTIYRITKDETRSLEMNTSSISQSPVFITISPCSRDVRWQLRRGNTELNNDNLSIIKEYNGGDTISFPVNIENNSRYVLQLTSSTGGAAAISVRGEASRSVRMRLRVRSKRRLVVNWDQSPIDPQTTTYCVVASTKRNYTTLCAAQLDIKKYTSSLNHKLTRSDSSADCPGSDPDLTDRTASSNNSNNSSETDNIIDNNGPDTFNVYERNVKSVFRRKKFSRSTRVTDDDPAIACVGDRTHHLIENLDPSKTYYVSLFGLAADRSAGSLLATGTVKPRSSTAKRLRENLPYKADIRGKSVYYFKATVGTGGGMWLAVTTCGGAVDVEVLARGKRLHFAKNIDPHSKFFVAAPMLPSSIQQSSEEISIQFDSSSEEARLRYVIRIVPSRWERVGALSVEIVASTTRWGMNTPELSEDGAVVRELRQRRSCRSVDIAFLPATHQLTDVIRYCTTARENTNGENYTCSSTRKSTTKIQCINHTQYLPTKAIVQKINGLKAGRKYALQVTASINGNTVPYNLLYIDTNVLCKEN